MPLSTDITLPKKYVPVFPNKCIVCHHVPDSTVNVAHNSHNPLLGFFAPVLLAFGWSRVAVPICRTCKPRYRLQRWGRFLVTVVLVVVAIWVISPRFSTWSPLWRKIVVAALVLVALSPYILAQVLLPPYFDTTASERSIDYEFASRDYAAEFHKLNKDQVLKSELS